MNLDRLHRRLTVLLSLASLLAFSGGAGLNPLSALAAALGLILAFFWQPDTSLSARLEKVWLPLALVLVARALIHVFFLRDDVVVPVVDLLLLLLTAEALRSLDTPNDARIYSLSFALLLASTAYRPGLLFLAGFVAYVVLATVLLMVGHLRREERRWGKTVEVSPAFLLASSGLSTVILGVSAVVFVAFPRVSEGWTGRGDAHTRSIAGFADEVTLGTHGSRIAGNPRIVLRVEFPRGAPGSLSSLYWRGRSYDAFDGVRWTRSPRLPPSQAPPAWYERWTGEVLAQKVYGTALDARILFATHPLLEVESESPIQHISNNAGDHLYWGTGAPAYTAYSLSGRPSPEQLRTAKGGFVPARTYYTQLPPLSDEVRTLADSLLTGLPSDYDRARALESWFQEEFEYSLQLPRTAREASLDHFLLSRRAGHCEYFSTAMAILLRTQGIATREVNGFLGGDWSEMGGYLAVTQNQAHSWVEVWFPGLGWVPFDPTPPGRGEGLSSRSWLWPGHFFFDAIQHRWNKWVLDYSYMTQFSLLERGKEAVADATGQTAGEMEGQGPSGRSLVLGMALLAGLLGVLLWIRAGSGEGRAEETRMFLRLRKAAGRAGLVEGELQSPGRMIRALRAAGHPASTPARVMVSLYLQARFSGKPLAEADRNRMRQAFRSALRTLRTPREGGKRGPPEPRR